MEAKVQPPLAPPQAIALAGPSVQVPGAASEVPDGYDDCSNPRGTLTKPKIRQWIMEKGWHLEADFPGFPPDKKDKATWCTFLAELIWKTVDDVENELTCPPGEACNISTRECVSEGELFDEKRPSMLLPLKSGRTATIYAKTKEKLQKLRPSLERFISEPKVPLSAQSCATVLSGTQEDLLEDLSCPAKESCNVDTSKCGKKQAGQIQLSLGGKSVTGSAENITELQKTLEQAPSAAQPSPVKQKPKVMFRPGHVVYGEEEKKRQAESSAWLSQLIGESKEIPEQVPKEVAKSKTSKPAKPSRKESIVQPAPVQEIPIPITEQPSEVSRLVKRLRDIRAEAAEPPVRLRIAESQLSKAIGTCVGIPS
jgi:hypothetical protein